MSGTELQGQVDEIDSSVQEVANRVESICSALLLSSVEPLEDLYYAGC